MVWKTGERKLNGKKREEEEDVEHTEKPGIVANFSIWIGGSCAAFLLGTSNKMLISFRPLVLTDFTPDIQQEINRLNRMLSAEAEANFQAYGAGDDWPKK